MNLIGLMLGIGPALAPTLGGVTLDLFGWQAIFVFMVLYGLALVGLFSTVVPETLAHPDPAAARPARLALSYGTLIRDLRFLRPSIVIACTTGGLYAMATMLPFVLIDEVGLTPTQFGVGMLAQSGSFMLGTLAMQQLLKRVEAHRLVPVGLGAILFGVALLGVLLRVAEPRFLTVMGPIGCFTFGIAFVMPSMMTESLAPFGRIAGAAAALTGFMQMGGGLLGSAVAAAMGDPVAALATVIPTMGAIAVLTYVGLRGAVTRMEQAVADRIVDPKRPAE
jgi:DHA1 family bicyclomycin/chloramphenicol resistance-like MFS transporter